jgi:hypothetical protein
LPPPGVTSQTPRRAPALPAPETIVKGPEHFKAFLSDVIKSTETFTRSRSSLSQLLDFLEKNTSAPIPFAGGTDDAKSNDAILKCKNPRDARIEKYKPAIKRLVSVWGTNKSYPPRPVVAAGSAGRATDIAIAEQVCKGLFDIKIIDVDFSDSVKAAAKKKVIGGKSLYEVVKAERDKYPAKYLEHESAMTNEKANAAVLRQPTLPLTNVNNIAKVVTKHGIAVCESIVATVISQCKAKGFAGRMEWIGIPYPVLLNPQEPDPKKRKFDTTKGHSIVVAHRQGQLNDVTTWGNYFIIDLWYYNLGMRGEYLIGEPAARSQYYQSDIANYVSRLKVMADIS